MATSNSDWKIASLNQKLSPGLKKHIARHINVSQRRQFALQALKISEDEYRKMEESKEPDPEMSMQDKIKQEEEMNFLVFKSAFFIALRHVLDQVEFFRKHKVGNINWLQIFT